MNKLTKNNYLVQFHLHKFVVSLFDILYFDTVFTLVFNNER